jgi:hypothetical protein
MSCEILIEIPDGPADGLFLGSAADVALMGRWAEGLPEEDYPNLARLFLRGEPVDAGPACQEADSALRSHPPDDRTRPGVEALAELLDRWPDATRARISDGAND